MSVSLSRVIQASSKVVNHELVSLFLYTEPGISSYKAIISVPELILCQAGWEKLMCFNDLKVPRSLTAPVYKLLLPGSTIALRLRLLHQLTSQVTSRFVPITVAQTLGSWVWISLEAWMSVCVRSVFVFFCMQVEALRRADPPPPQRSPTDYV
jgi:hypothetical protein